MYCTVVYKATITTAQYEYEYIYYMYVWEIIVDNYSSKLVTTGIIGELGGVLRLQYL